MVAARATAITGLSHSLRQYRTDQAYIRAVPPSSVFSDRLLNSIVKNKPNSISALLKLPGIGPARCQHYGRDIVRMVNLNAKKKGAQKNKKSKALGISKKPETKCKKKSKTTKKTQGLRVKPNNGKLPSNRKLFDYRKSKGTYARTEVGKTEARPQIAPRKGKAYPIPSSDRPASFPVSNQAIIPKRLPPSQKTSVYVLELEDGRVYVGSSKDVPRRISQHTAGTGSAYTRLYKPTGIQLPRLGNIEGDGDAAERDETLRYMMLRGVPFVRGWKFTRIAMPPEEFEEAEANIRELFNLCRRCGYKGHFCTQCRATFDRLGNPIV